MTGNDPVPAGRQPAIQTTRPHAHWLLPTDLNGGLHSQSVTCSPLHQEEILESHVGIEPTSSAWKAEVLAAIRMEQLEWNTGIEPVYPPWQGGTLATMLIPHWSPIEDLNLFLMIPNHERCQVTLIGDLVVQEGIEPSIPYGL